MTSSFPANLSRDDHLPTDLLPTSRRDPEAGFMGLPFTEPESEHEWEGWFDWDTFDKEQQFD